MYYYNWFLRSKISETQAILCTQTNFYWKPSTFFKNFAWIMILISNFLIFYVLNEIKSHHNILQINYICFIFYKIIDLIRIREIPRQFIYLLVWRKKKSKFMKNYWSGLSDFKVFNLPLILKQHILKHLVYALHY